MCILKFQKYRRIYEERYKEKNIVFSEKSNYITIHLQNETRVDNCKQNSKK